MIKQLTVLVVTFVAGIGLGMYLNFPEKNYSGAYETTDTSKSSGENLRCENQSMPSAKPVSIARLPNRKIQKQNSRNSFIL